MQESSKKEIFSLVKIVLFAVVIAFIFRQFLFIPTIVKGESMEPTFENNNGVLVSKTSNIERFDLIVFEAPDSNETYIKRVIGLPGDRIKAEKDVLYVNGQAYKEQYVNRKFDSGVTVNQVTCDFTLEQLTGESVVPEGHLFVLGDNRLKSKDSREFGFISKKAVIGEVKFRFFPFDEITVLK